MTLLIILILLADITNSLISHFISICSNCLKNLNDYDEFSSKAQEIQLEVKNLLDLKVIIKQEVIVEDLNVQNYPEIVIDELPVIKVEEIPIIKEKSAQKVKKIQKIASKPAQKRHACDFPGCDRSYKEKSELRDHFLRVHSDERPFTCEICGNFSLNY